MGRQLSLVAVLALAGCGDDGVPPMDPASLSCVFSDAPDAGMTAGATCLEYRGEFAREDCPAGAGYVETDSCPAEGRLGMCVNRSDSSFGYSETTLLVYEESALAANEESCRLGGGTWTPTSAPDP